MEPTDLTIEILKDIRAEIRETRLDLETLTRRVVESEIRTTTAITDLAGTVRDLTGILRASHDLRPRVERCEVDIADLKRRLS